MDAAKLKKAHKLYKLVHRPTGNVHADEVARRTFDEYCVKHHITIEMLMDSVDVVNSFTFNDAYTAEIFMFTILKTGEEEDVETEISYASNTFTCRITAPQRFTDRAHARAMKLIRKYEITRESVKKKLAAQEKQVQESIVIQARLLRFGQKLLKFSEPVFYNAFIYKYEIIPQSILDRAANQPPSESKLDENELRAMHGMFNKEVLDNQLDQ